MCGRRIEADRTANLRVPKISSIITTEWGHPSSLNHAYETVVAFYFGFIAVPAQNQDLGIARDGLRGRASRQGDLSIAIRHEILLDRGHTRIRHLTILRPSLPGRTQN